MAEAVGIDDRFDTLGKSDAFSVGLKASAMPASEKGDGATRLSHVRKPHAASTFQRTDPLTGVAINDIVDKTLSSAPIDLGYLDVHRAGPHGPGMVPIERSSRSLLAFPSDYGHGHRPHVNCFTSSCDPVPRLFATDENTIGGQYEIGGRSGIGSGDEPRQDHEFAAYD
jgi:hypothetical protein